MILSLIKELLVPYKQHLQSPDFSHLYKWELLKTFQDHWDLAAADFGAMYATSFPKDVENPYRDEAFHYPKKVMQAFIEMSPDTVREMFQILFDEKNGLSVEQRILFFTSQCDEFFKGMPQGKEYFDDHFHNSRKLLSFYLSLHSPSLYAVFNYPEFANFMQLVKARSIPSPNETGRFFTVCRSVQKVLEQADPEVFSLLQANLSSEHYQGESLILVQDFITFSGR